MILPSFISNIKIHIIAILILLLSVELHCATQIKTISNVTNSLRYNWVFVDTIHIDSPILINIKGIGYLNSKESDFFDDPKSITQSPYTCATYYTFDNKKVGIHDFQFYTLLARQKAFINKFNASNEIILDDFYYSATKKGCEIYECKKPKIVVFVFLILNRTFMQTLNPFIDYIDETYKRKEVKIKTEFPELEYIRVGAPVILIDQ